MPNESSESVTETVTIDIRGFDPADAIQLANGTEDTAYNFSAGDLLNGVTDPDVTPEGVKDVDNLQVTGLSATNGTISGNSTDGYTFTPNDNFNGLANINYTIIDGNGGTVTNSVTVNIVAVNDAPTATFTVAQTTTEGNNALTGTLTSADVDSQDQLAEGQVADTATYSLKSAAITDADGNAINDANGVPIAVQGLEVKADGSGPLTPLTPPTTPSPMVKFKKSTSPIKSLIPMDSQAKTPSSSPSPVPTTIPSPRSPQPKPQQKTTSHYPSTDSSRPAMTTGLSPMHSALPQLPSTDSPSTPMAPGPLMPPLTTHSPSPTVKLKPSPLLSMSPMLKTLSPTAPLTSLSPVPPTASTSPLLMRPTSSQVSSQQLMSMPQTPSPTASSALISQA